MRHVIAAKVLRISKGWCHSSMEMAWKDPFPGHAMPRHATLALRLCKRRVVDAAPRPQLGLGDVGQCTLDLLQKHVPTVHGVLQARGSFVVFFL